MSTLFDKASMGSTFAAIAFVASYFIYDPIKGSDVSRGTKMMSSIFPSVAIALGSTAGAELESAGLGITFGNITTVYNNYAFSDAFFMLFFNTIFYFVLGLYLEQVVPSEYGINKPWHFPISQFFPKKVDPDHQVSLLDDVDTGDELNNLNEVYTKFETPGPDERGEEMIRIRKLRKAFPVKIDGSNQKEFVAVRSLSLDMYKGQIFTLLGHNGAGKTTTISMLTGLFEPSSGEVKIMGQDIKKDMDSIRKNFGFCPQHDLLYPFLSVEEHLYLYCAIKGVPKEKQDFAVTNMIEDVGLGETGDNKRHALAGTLSGGQMRKLSVGIALLNDSPVVFLDEPSSGMDVASQRFIWELLIKSKKDRVILLTTHSMEEAEISDRIAILAHSVLQCNGSPHYLKNNYGVGYTLTISKADSSLSIPEANYYTGCATASGTVIAKDFLTKYPFCELLSDAGGEISFRLPFSHVSQFPDMFDLLESRKTELGINSFGVSVTTLTEVFLKVGHGHEGVPENAKIDDDDNSDSDDDSDDDNPNVMPSDLGDLGTHPDFPVSSHSLNSVNSDDDDDKTALNPDVEKISIDEAFSGGQRMLTGIPLFTKHTRALFMKRFHSARRDRKQWMWQVLYPAIVLISSLALLKSNNDPESPARVMNPLIYDPPTILPFANVHKSPAVTALGDHYNPFYYTLRRLDDSNFSPFQSDMAPMDTADYLTTWDDTLMADMNTIDINLAMESMVSTVDVVDASEISNLSDLSEVQNVNRTHFQKYLLSTANKADVRYSAIAVNDFNPTPVEGKPLLNAIIGFNSSASFDALPVAWNSLSNSILQHHYRNVKSDEVLEEENPSFLSSVWSYFSDSKLQDKKNLPSIRTALRPFDRTQNEMVWSTGMAAFAIAMAFAFVPATFAGFLVKERFDKGKHLQVISGVSPYAYWASTFIWDMLNYTAPFVMTLIILALFDITPLFGVCFIPTIFVFWFYCMAVAPFTYCISFLFDNQNAAMNMMLLMNFMISVILLITSVVMEIITATKDIAPILKFFYRLLPQFAFAEGIAAAFFRTSPSFHAVPPSPYSLKSMGYPMLFLLLDFVLYSALLFFIEYATTHNTWEQLFGSGSLSEEDTAETTEDSDVSDEREAIQSGLRDDDSIYSVVLRGLRKVYPSRMGAKPNVAVNNLYFSIKKGECFGFLGANGAGKSTTMKMLTGDGSPTGGHAQLGGYDIMHDTDKVRQLIGYCPQFDALLPLLTAREHLQLYARIKCVSESKIDGYVNYLIDKLGLAHLADRPAGSYSGGNRRKLSVGISLVGNPTIVFLDEPSTGVDPQSRRHMIKLISSTMKHRSVILSSHSMEEVEALCDRVGIMTHGNLQCFGSPMHIKNKYGSGWQVLIKVVEGSMASVKAHILAMYEGTEIIEEHGVNLKLRVPKGQNTLGSVFRDLEGCKSLGVESYSVSNTDLESVFINFVQASLRRAQEKRGNEPSYNTIF